MTTDNAPIGVTRIASVKALCVSLHRSERPIFHSLCGEVAYLPNDHHDHAYISLAPPYTHLECLPVHHSQLFKYPTPSPAAFPYFLVDAISPFFLTTKLYVNRCLALDLDLGSLPGTNEESTRYCKADTDDLELRVFRFCRSRC